MRFLDAIIKGFKAIVLGFGRLVSYLVPFNPNSKLPLIVRLVVWFLLIAVVVAILYAINNWARIGPSVRVRSAQHIWLPIIGVLTILIGIVAYWLYRLGQDDGASPYPDIDEAWREATLALEQAGIRLSEEPLFLVLGRPQTAEKNLFEAPGVELLVPQTPANPRAPLSVFATRGPKGLGVYVTCRGASLLGRLAGILALEEMGDVEVNAEDENAIEGTMVLKPGQKGREVYELARKGELTKLDLRKVRRTLGKTRHGPDFLNVNAEVARLNSRLRHLCRLIARDRQPFCPANGILLLVPLGATDSAQDAEDACRACQGDIKIIRQATKLDCPVLSLLVDMEDVPGFVEFTKRVPQPNLARRIGQRFTMVPSLPRDKIRSEIERALRYACTSYLRQNNVYQAYRLESAAAQGAAAERPYDNDRLFLLLDEMRTRVDFLCSALARVVVPDGAATSLRYLGCYFAATGPRSDNRSGFVGGALERLLDEQSRVAWTEEAKAHNADCRTWAGYYLAATCVLALALAGLIVWRFLP